MFSTSKTNRLTRFSSLEHLSLYKLLGDRTQWLICAHAEKHKARRIKLKHKIFGKLTSWYPLYQNSLGFPQPEKWHLALHLISTVRGDITFLAEPPSTCYWSHPLVYQAQSKLVMQGTGEGAPFLHSFSDWSPTLTFLWGHTYWVSPSCVLLWLMVSNLYFTCHGGFHASRAREEILDRFKPINLMRATQWLKQRLALNLSLRWSQEPEDIW